MRNLDVRIIVDESGVTYKQIAKELGITPEWVSRLMAEELTSANRERILAALERIKEAEKYVSG